MKSPVVLCIGGWDPSGRAGLLADVWAIGQLGGRPAGVVTAITAQGAVFKSTPVSPDQIRRQVRAALEVHPACSVKIGMVPDRRSLRRLAGAIGGSTRWVVVDPVVNSSTGDRLSTLTAADYLGLRSYFSPKTRVVLTPNAAELRWLAVTPTQLLERGYAAVVVKGGESGIDLIFSRGTRPASLLGSRLRRSTSHHRGTGCRFASGLAVGLARGEDLVPATRRAKRLVRKFLSSL